jgi:hypothetical protein
VQIERAALFGVATVSSGIVAAFAVGQTERLYGVPRYLVTLF